jgi:hypothetical protein
MKRLLRGVCNGLRAEHLDRDGSVKVSVVRAIHDTHSTLAKLFFDAVMSERLADQNGLSPD